jgi:Flp pilus assembly protein TadG
MPVSLLSALRIRSVVKGFSGNRKGSAAVQFALVAPLFFAVIFAIIESALVYFAGQILETGTRDTARLILTHQAQDSSLSAQDFKTTLCNSVSMLLNCNLLSVDVRSYPVSPPTAITPYSPINAAGQYAPNTVYLPPPANDSSIVLVRAFYPWPLFVTGLGFNLTNVGSNSRLLIATAAFRVEPGSGS